MRRRMKRSFLCIIAFVVAGQLAGCGDDNPPGPGGMDARPDVVADTADASADKPADTVESDANIDVVDAPDTQPVQDVRANIDCGAIGCGASLVFKVPGFIARFGAEARLIDVTACRGTSCADSRVQLMENGISHVTRGDGGPDRVLAVLLNDTLQVDFTASTLPTVPMPRQEQVQLRIVTSGGRGLVDFRTQAPVEVFCPGGLGCVICEKIWVQLDSADGGQPVDANDHPGQAGVCQ